MDGSDHHGRRTSRSHSLQSVQGGEVAQVDRSLSNAQPPVHDQVQPFDNTTAAQSARSDHPYYTSDRSPYTQQYSPPQSDICRDYSRGEYGSGDRHHPLPGDPPSRDVSSPGQIHSPQQHVSHHEQYSALPPYPQYQVEDLDYSPWVACGPAEVVNLGYIGDLAFVPLSADFSGFHPHPSCRYPNCSLPVIRDERTHELTEYCGLEHMRDDIRRGVPLCLACDRYPRRHTGGDYCGSHCEEWAVRRQQQLQRDQLHHPHWQ